MLPEEAYAPFVGIQPPFPTWHDATPGPCYFNLTVLHALQGLSCFSACLNTLLFFSLNLFLASSIIVCLSICLFVCLTDFYLLYSLGLYKAHIYKFFDLDSFDVDEYEHFEQVVLSFLFVCCLFSLIFSLFQ